MSHLLIVLIPVLVAPVVLLLAFAGCASFKASNEYAPTPPATPSVPVPVVHYWDVILATPGLHSYWRLDETSGVTAYDTGKLKRPGTYSSGLTPGTATGALQPKEAGDRATAFDGSGDHVTVDFNPNLNTPSFSVEAWVRPAGTTRYEAIISSWQLTPTVVQGFELGLEAPDRLRGRVGTGTDIKVLETQLPTPPAQGVWYHVVMTFDAGSGALVLYWDGDLRAKNTFTYIPNAGASDPLRIGAGRRPAQPTDTSPANFFTGSIDEVAVYGVALSQGDVTAHKTAR